LSSCLIDEAISIELGVVEREAITDNTDIVVGPIYTTEEGRSKTCSRIICDTYVMFNIQGPSCVNTWLLDLPFPFL